MKNYSSVIIGHVSQDINIDHLGNEVKIAGGAVLYSSASAYALGHDVFAVTKMAEADLKVLDAFTLPKENLLCLPSKKSTSIRNQYFTADKERRKSTCISQGDPFAADEIPGDISADIFHIAGLIYGDYEDGIVEKLSKRGKVAVDVQGYLRHADKNTGEMFFEDWADKKRLFPHISFLKTDAAEAEILTGLTDRTAAAKLMHEWGAGEIMITHNTEVLIYDGSKVYTCPLRARNLSGRTGRGDTTFAAYINERLVSGIEKSLLYASATVSLKMETPGVFKGGRNDVDEYIKLIYPEFV